MIPLIGSDYPKKVIPLIDGAKKNVHIVMYDWRWYPNQPGHSVQQFNAALVRAVGRGVVVRAVLNTADIVPVLASVGIKARTMRDKRTLHSKLLLIDSSVLVIGSHNITRNAFGSNIEASVVVELPGDVTRFSEFFENLYNI